MRAESTVSTATWNSISAAAQLCGDAIEAHGSPCSFDAGSTLIEGGAPLERLLYLRQGEVELEAPEGQLIRLQAPTLLGEMSFLSQACATVQVTAATDCSGNALSHAALDDLARAQPDLGVQLLKGLAALAISRLSSRYHERYVALIAHDSRKDELLQLVQDKRDFFAGVNLVGTANTTQAVEERTGLRASRRVHSGPHGGDQEIGALVARGLVTAVFFFRDPLWAQPHQADVGALLRVCELHDTPLATTPASARLIIDGFSRR